MEEANTNKPFSSRRKRLIVIIIVALLFLLSGIYYFAVQDRDKVDISVSGTTYRMNLFIESPKDIYVVGNKFKVGVVGEFPSTSNSTLATAEVRINFDQTKLKATSIFDNVNTLTAFKQLDNARGIVTVDIAQIGGAGFTGSVVLTAIEFEVIATNTQSASITFDEESTLGIPNAWNSVTSITNLTIPFVPQSTGISNITLEKILRPGNSTDIYIPGQEAQFRVILDLPDQHDYRAMALKVQYDKNYFEPAPTMFNVDSTLQTAGEKACVSAGTNFGCQEISIAKIGTGKFTDGQIATFKLRSKQALGASQTAVISVNATTQPIPTDNLVGKYSYLQNPNLATQADYFAYTPNSQVTMTGSTVIVCGNGIVEGAEICDDGNTQDNDQCSASCTNACVSPQIWNGSQCINPVIDYCLGDYNSVRGLENAIVDLSDFSIFAKNFNINLTDDDLKYDLVKSTGQTDNILDVSDFSIFGSNYGRDVCQKLRSQYPLN